jgi:hypothetical protein
VCVTLIHKSQKKKIGVVNSLNLTGLKIMTDKKSVFLNSLLKFAKEERDKWENNRVAPISPSPFDLIEMYI